MKVALVRLIIFRPFVPRSADGYCFADQYSIPLPADLPPTYKGRVLKFAYQLLVGVCRASSHSSPKVNGSTSASTNLSTSRIMRVPVRVYNNVSGQS